MNNILKKILLIIILWLINQHIFTQSIGVGTTTPTNFFHVAPPAGTLDPLRVELIRLYANETDVLVIDGSGVVKYMPVNDILPNVNPATLDSIILNSVLSQSDTIYNNQEVRDSILSIVSSQLDSLLLNSSIFDSLYVFISDSLINDNTFKDSMFSYIRDSLTLDNSFFDSIYTLISDSLLNDTGWINELEDSLGNSSDDQNLDSITLVSTTITTYIEDGTDANVDLLPLATDSAFYKAIRDSLLNDSLFVDQLDSLILSDTNFINGLIDSLLANDYFKDSLFSFTRDSLIQDTKFFDSIYELVSDSLLDDIDWLSELADSLANNFTDDQNLDSITLVSTTITTYIEDGTDASVSLLPLASDSAFYSTIRDSLLNDSLFINQLDSLILSDSNFINGIVDSLLANDLFKDSLFSFTRDSLIQDASFFDSMFTQIRDSLVFDQDFLDSIYASISDSLLNDNSWLTELADSIDTDEQNLYVGSGGAGTAVVGIQRGDSIVIEAGANINLTASGDTITINGTAGGSGDLTDIIAGDGLTGTNLTGPIPTLHATANNGLNVDALADSIQLGGPLVENTTIDQNVYDMVYDLTDTGVFKVEDGDSTAFIVTDSSRVGVLIEKPRSNLHVAGSFGAKVVDIDHTNSPYIAGNETFIIADATTSAILIELPPVAQVRDRVYHFKKIDAVNTVTIDANAAETIDGATTFVLSGQYDKVKIVCNGSAWFIMEGGNSSGSGSGGDSPCFTCDGY